MKSADVAWIWVALALVGLFTRAPAEDWPQWRYDAYRSANSPEKLPTDLHLQWVHQYTPRVQTWDDPLNNDLISFDRIFEPVVLGNRLFIGFNDCDKVVALDIETGRELWTFFTDGPVRLPPAAWNGRVYFTSDDGYLYCVKAEDGVLLWKFHGGPSARKVLGNGRVISAWPARGGPVVRDGQVYFAASIWPFMGTFIYALDARTGALTWVNDGTGAQYMKQPHSAPSFAGVAPQGALVATRDYLLVPGGRSVPAGFDRKTGKFVHYQLEDSGKGNGGSFVMGNDTEFFVHTRFRGTRSYDIKSGKKATFTINEPVVTTNRLYSTQDHSFLKTAVLDATAKLADARQTELDARVEVSTAQETGDKEAYKKATNSLASARKKLTKAETDFATAQKNLSTNWDGAVLQSVGQDKKVRWEVPVYTWGEMIKAGQRLYMAGTNVLMAFDLPADKSKARLVWSKYVDGQVMRLLAANGKLFAVTLDGRIMAFGRKTATTPLLAKAAQASLHGSPEPNGIPDAPSELERGPEGYALWYGIDDAEVLKSVIQESKVHVVGVDPSSTKLESLRMHFSSLGLYGNRLALHEGDPLTFKAPPYIANLVVIGQSLAPSLANRQFLKAAFDSVRPYGGRLWIWADPHQSEDLARELIGADLPQAKVSVEKRGVVVVREGPLLGSGDWTHQYGNIANTVKSDDRLVKLPLGLLWFGGPTHADVLPRHGHGPSEQVVGGVLFIEGMDCLSARDVYTGRVLWKTEFSDLGNYGMYYDNSYTNLPLTTAYNQKHIIGANGRGANFVATADAVYVLATNRCLVLDPASGRVVRTINASFVQAADQPLQWTYIGVARDVLLAGIDFAEYTRRFDLWPTNKALATNRTPAAVDFFASRALVAFNRHTGQPLWRRDARHSFVHNTIVAGNNRVYCVDKLPRSTESKLKRRGRVAPKDYRLSAFDLQTGQLIWEATNNVFGTWLSYSEPYDVLLQAGASAPDRLNDEADKGMIAYRGKDGLILWSNLAVKYTGPCILHGDTILTTPSSYKTNAGVFGLLNGLPRGVRNPLTDQVEPVRMYRTYGCNYPVACENLLTFRSGAAGFYDLATHSGSGNFGGFKSGCSPNLIAANGVLNAPDYTRTCSCPYQNQTSLALIHWPEDELETWTHNQFGADNREGIRISRIGINLGAPGDRLGDTGTLWLEHPTVGGSSPSLSIVVRGKTNYFRRHISGMKGEGPTWVMASGVSGVDTIAIGPETRKPAPPPPAPQKKPGEEEDKDEIVNDTKAKNGNGSSQTNTTAAAAAQRNSAGTSGTNQPVTLSTNGVGKAASTNKVEAPYISKLKSARYTVRLYFADPEDLLPGQRVFNVKLQDRVVLRNFDVVAAAGGPRRGVVKEFRRITVGHQLLIELSRKKGINYPPLINGVEMILEQP